MQILLIMLIVVLLAFLVLLLALAKQSPREKQTEDKEQEEYIRDYAETVRQTGGSMKKLEHWKVIAIYLIIYDMIAVNFSYFMALLVRFDFRYSSIPTDYFAAWKSFAPIYTIIILVVFGCMHLYNSVWRFASFHELIKITVATVITGVLHIVGITIFWERMPASYYLIGIMLQFFLTVGVRFSYRFVLLERNRREKSEREERSKNVMIIGAGEAGRTIVRELQNAKETNSRVRCLIDDNPNKWGRYMEGVPVVGGRDDIFLNVDKYHINQILLAIPTATPHQKRDILNICKETGCELKQLPGVYQLVNGEVSLSKMKKVAVEDLLGRDTIKVNMSEIFQYLKGKRILVTGGGGSIGSELCRQIAGHEPELLVIFDIYENNAYDIEQELKASYPNLNGEVSLSKMKKVAVEDLLGRDTIKVNMSEIFQYLKGKRILVTGGGGSIGSELCRQIAGHEPELLVIFDIYENNAYDIEQELKASYPNLNLKVLIGSVRDSKRINWVFETYKPEIVYHAAAHKHVPLMENSPCEAIKNNVVGTYKTAYAAMMNGCQRFVLISTDKAVNPTNIMGASKRLCEMVVQSMNMVSHNGHTDWLPRLGGHRKDTLDALHDNEGQAYVSENPASEAGTGTEFVAVRFGNVLGSNGSVIPLFKRQIEKGGPVTVTHPDIIRYFMTIPEAVSLVLQAGTYAKGGEIFVLDMGAPVKIDTLARNLIKLSGYTPDVDIKVTYTGLRPGEKLYEEKLMAEEGMEKTPNDLIHIGKPIEMDVQEFFKQLEVLAAYGYANSEKIRDIVAAIVPTYHSADSDLKLHKKVYEELMSEAAVAAEKN